MSSVTGKMELGQKDLYTTNSESNNESNKTNGNSFLLKPEEYISNLKRENTRLNLDLKNISENLNYLFTLANGNNDSKPILIEKISDLKKRFQKETPQIKPKPTDYDLSRKELKSLIAELSNFDQQIFDELKEIDLKNMANLDTNYIKKFKNFSVQIEKKKKALEYGIQNLDLKIKEEAEFSTTSPEFIRKASALAGISEDKWPEFQKLHENRQEIRKVQLKNLKNDCEVLKKLTEIIEKRLSYLAACKEISDLLPLHQLNMQEQEKRSASFAESIQELSAISHLGQANFAYEEFDEKINDLTNTWVLRKKINSLNDVLQNETSSEYQNITKIVKEQALAFNVDEEKLNASMLKVQQNLNFISSLKEIVNLFSKHQKTVQELEYLDSCLDKAIEPFKGETPDLAKAKLVHQEYLNSLNKTSIVSYNELLKTIQDLYKNVSSYNCEEYSKISKIILQQINALVKDADAIPSLRKHILKQLNTLNSIAYPIGYFNYLKNLFVNGLSEEKTVKIEKVAPKEEETQLTTKIESLDVIENHFVKNKMGNEKENTISEEAKVTENA